MPGAYHRVERKETLWSISQRYNVDLDTLVRVNHLADSGQINAGQSLFIPTPQAVPVPRTTTTSVRVAAAASAPLVADGNNFIWPVEGHVLSAFGSRSNGVANQGIDVAAPAGTTVVASRGGRVAFIGEEVPGYGKTIILDHGDDYHTVYACNSEVLVQTGQIVAQRQPIATVGTSGRATSPSLHFEIRRGHRPQNPFYFLP